MKVRMLLFLLAIIGWVTLSCTEVETYESATVRHSSLGTGGAAGMGGAGADLPNILLIILDDVGAESSSLYPELVGDTGAVSTPNIEDLAANGLVFDNAWSSPLCSPTRSTIVSGRYTHHTGVTDVSEEAVLPVDTVTIFDRLTAETVYGQGFFGKYHLGGKGLNNTGHVADIGVPFFKGLLWNLKSPENHFNWDVHSLDSPTYRSTTYSTVGITDMAVEFIQDHEATRPGDPWFVYLAYAAAHAPFQVPPSELHSVDLGGATPGTVLNTLDNYKATVQSFDTTFGQLLEEINLEETTVIIIGDNGTPAEMKDTGTNVKNSKSTIYQGGVHVPLIIAGAGVTRQGREDALVTSTDLYATILSLAGLPVTHVYNSYSLLPLLSDENATSGRTHSFTERASPSGSGHRYAIRDERYKLMYNGGANPWALYDLVANPKESANKYNKPAYATQQASLEAALAPIIAEAPPQFFP